MIVLGIETSCDETSAAVVKGTEVLSNVVASQADLHRKWGGVVPEAAARAHVEAIVPVIAEAMRVAGEPVLDAVAVTNRPGLVGALSVGVTAAKAIAYGRRLPLVGVHHLEGHLLSPLANGVHVPFPHLSLIVSGGHTELVHVLEPGRYHLLGETRDDAAGEAFDKAARLLGLGYPGGKAIQDAATGGDRYRYPLPKALSDQPYEFSFSGLKTAILRLVEKEGKQLDHKDAAASVQEAITAVLAEKAAAAADAFGAKALTLVGGVAANTLLRERLTRLCTQSAVAFFTPPLDLCTDNAAMIGIAAGFRLAANEHDSLDLEVSSTGEIPGSSH